MIDARFEDGAESPLRLQALDGDDLTILSALVQDSVLNARDMRWQKGQRRFAMLLNRFRWEDRPRAVRAGDYERVQSLLVVSDVVAVSSTGFDRGDGDLVLSLLSLRFDAADDGAGVLSLTLAGDGEIRLQVECLDVALRDVTRPHAARGLPRHPEGDE